MAKRLAGLGAVLLAVAVLVDLQPWWWAALVAHPVLFGAGLPGLALIIAAAVIRRRPRTPAEPWLLSYPGLLTVTAAVAGVGVAGLAIMLKLAAGSPVAARPALQIDAIKYGLGIFAAGGAVAALLLGVRRQRHTEQAQAHTELDAAERRVTDLYTKAVEQLGHADAAVRLGGLYALERVAQNAVGQRQTVVNVLCAYLRMPASDDRDTQQELQVRMAAQLIITDHVELPAGAGVTPDPQQPFWPGIDLDLAGATLVDWRMRRGHVRNAWFGGTTFTGGARFDDATFSGDARFEKATFGGGAVFTGVVFDARALFTGAELSGGAWFDGAAFTGDARFEGATLAGGARFGEVTFGGDARFDRAVFAGGARFSKATFTGLACFNDASFAGSARFGATAFLGTARFLAATFAKDPAFALCRVPPGDQRHDIWPPYWRADGSGTLVHEPLAAAE